MIDLKNFLNIKHSTRNLSDEQFESIVDALALQLEQISFISNYKKEQLYVDWRNLFNWEPTSNSINSTHRLGLKLCEHFFPNFYDIEDIKGRSFRNQWNKDNLVKILKWNRKSHETPYLSELKRGIYFCCGLPKSTMFRPQMAKILVNKYHAKTVFDPCCGWGGRMLGSVSTGAHYTGFEPNTQTYENLCNLAKFLDIENKVTLICDDAINIPKYDLPKVDLVLTSPPYFNLEVYSKEETQSIQKYTEYDMWSTAFLQTIIEHSLSIINDDGVSCWNVAKVGKNDMHNDVLKYHEKNGFERIEQFDVISSKRQALQKNGLTKSKDTTFSYKKLNRFK